MHKCWKFGLLSRDRFYGHSYIYQVSNWGVRYVEEGYQYRKSEAQMKLLNYILEYGNDSEKRWAEEVLAPQLLQRFFPGRQAQNIDLYVDFHEAVLNATDTLQRRIESEAFEPDEELFIECYNDVLILYAVLQLSRYLHPTLYTQDDRNITFEEFRKIMRDVIDDIILYDPPSIILLRGLGRNGEMYAHPRSKPRIEHRPNDADYEKLLDLYLKMSALTDTLYSPRPT
jgi:hypothetical protein